MTAGKESPMDTPLKWGPFLMSIILAVGGYVYQQGQISAKQAQTDAIVTELRTEYQQGQKDATEQKQLAAVHYTESQDFQASTLQKLNEIVDRVVAMEHSKR